MSKEYHFGLIGYPIEHSLSPVLHRAALQAAGKPGDYQLIPVMGLPQGSSQLFAVLEKVRGGELDGINITVPHKQNVLPFLDELSTSARSTGAVNTIFKRDGILVGENTDIAGFINDLKRIGIKQQTDQMAFVLGAGGGARAVIWGLLNSGWQVNIFARRPEQGQQIVDWFRRNSVNTGQSIDNRLSAFILNSRTVERMIGEQTVHLIVNATPLGMTSQLQGNAWPDGVPFPREAIIYDLVYSPAQTELIKHARQNGLLAFNGLGMLVEQAALAFEIWTGEPAPREAMRLAVKDWEMES